MVNWLVLFITNIIRGNMYWETKGNIFNFLNKFLHGVTVFYLSLPDYGYKWARSPGLHVSISTNIQWGGTNWKVCLFTYSQSFTVSTKLKPPPLECDTSSWCLCQQHNEPTGFDSYWPLYSPFISQARSKLVPHHKQSHAFNMYGY
jgi:hypothetical protein